MAKPIAVIKPLNKNALANLVIEVNHNGFSIWTTETIGKRKIKHWIVDGSCIKEDGEIRIGKDILTYKQFAKTTKNGITLVQKSTKTP